MSHLPTKHPTAKESGKRSPTSQKRKLPVSPKQLSAPRAKNDPLLENPWYAECLEFLAAQNAYEIEDAGHPRIHVVDQYLKMVMDGLKQHRPDLLATCGGSPLTFLLFQVEDFIERNRQPQIPRAFIWTLYYRLEENLRLKDEYATHGPDRALAAQKLRMRGLL
jgi:hypothetical protein